MVPAVGGRGGVESTHYTTPVRRVPISTIVHQVPHYNTHGTALYHTRYHTTPYMVLHCTTPGTPLHHIKYFTKLHFTWYYSNTTQRYTSIHNSYTLAASDTKSRPSTVSLKNCPLYSSEENVYINPVCKVLLN